MNYASFYPPAVQNALSHVAPGSWIPRVPDAAIRLHAGYPAPSAVPVQSLSESFHSVVLEEGHLPFQYLGSTSMKALPRLVLNRLRERGMNLTEDELLITSGAAQGIDLCARVFLDEGSAVAVESPTYMEALEMFRNYTDDIIEVPLNHDGLDPQAFEEILMKRQANGQRLPKFLYTIPSFHNPTGSLMTIGTRKRLLQLADRYDFLIIEDDAYGELYFDEIPKPIKSLDDGHRVIYLGSLSKVVAPGLRIGWAAAPQSIIRALAWFKKDLDHPFMQAAAARYLELQSWHEHMGLLRDTYRNRRDAMLFALGKYMPDQVRWGTPRGGYFVWVHVPRMDTDFLLQSALTQGVSYLPGKHFYHSSRHGREFLRLSYSHVSLPEIDLGVKRLAELLQAERGEKTV